MVAGCQIHYAIKCNQKPNDGAVKDYTTSTTREKTIEFYERPTNIWIAE